MRMVFTIVSRIPVGDYPEIIQLLPGDMLADKIKDFLMNAELGGYWQGVGLAFGFPPSGLRIFDRMLHPGDQLPGSPPVHL